MVQLGMILYNTMKKREMCFLMWTDQCNTYLHVYSCSTEISHKKVYIIIIIIIVVVAIIIIHASFVSQLLFACSFDKTLSAVVIRAVCLCHRRVVSVCRVP